MKTYTFQGIYGRNCGNVTPYNGPSKRLQEKGFEVKNGIATLRGYAKISDLAAASRPKYEEYQRALNPEHVADIAHFLADCKAEAKFLPEVILSVNTSTNTTLKPYTHKSFQQLSKTGQGAILNMEYYELEVEEGALTRIDGNHRLEAGKELDFYVPFSIILWTEQTADGEDTPPAFSADNTESEAFLFYILNNTAKKLEAEENFKGLVKSKKWSEKELALINRHLPLLKHYSEQYAAHSLARTEYLYAPLSQICDVLQEITCDYPDRETFDALVVDAITIVKQVDKYLYIKSEFGRIFFQLAFYTRYKSDNLESACHTLEDLDRWLKRYQYTGSAFTKVSELFDVGYKHIHLAPKTIFMAMQYKSDQAVRDYNNALSRAATRLNQLCPDVPLEAYPIMTGEGRSINITRDIYEKIDRCAVFLADTTEANPNVMYELGIAYSKKKPIIMVREKEKAKKVPSDIISDYYYTFTGVTELEELFFKHIKKIMETDYGVVYKE